jgi:hypothetical protein
MGWAGLPKNIIGPYWTGMSGLWAIMGWANGLLGRPIKELKKKSKYNFT